MKRLTLSNDLLTGIVDVDQQHRELLSWANATLFPEKGRQNSRFFAETIVFLSRYAFYHFLAEEHAMTEHRYDRLQGHMGQHERLRDKIMELLKTTENQGVIRSVKSQLYYLFSESFADHIKNWDGDFAAYLSNRNKLESTSLAGLNDLLGQKQTTDALSDLLDDKTVDDLKSK